MATTTWPAVVDAVIAQYLAQPGYRGPASTSATGTLVLDGAESGLLEDRGQLFVIVGVSIDEAGNPIEPGTSQQEPAAMGPSRPRDETGTIHCLAVAETGDASLEARSMKACRDLAYGIVGTAETFCRTDPKLGGVPGLQWAFVTASMPTQYAGAGLVVEVPFTIAYFARL